MLSKIGLNKKGQMGETVTWVFATLIIIVVLAISIFVSSFYLGKFKQIQGSYAQIGDIPISKSFYSYLLTDNDAKQTVYSQLKTDRNLNDFNGNLALELFNGNKKLRIYQGTADEHPIVWLGLINTSSINIEGPSVSNRYFGPRTEGAPSTNVELSERIVLDEKQSVNLFVSRPELVK
jgi:hypothetical protein